MIFYLIHDCIECQTDKHVAIKPNKISPPLHYLILKTQLTLVTEFVWTLNELFIHRLREILLFCHN